MDYYSPSDLKMEPKIVSIVVKWRGSVVWVLFSGFLYKEGYNFTFFSFLD